MEKKRLDQLLFDRGLFDSREKAKAAVMEGIVYIKGQKAEKPGTAVADDCDVEVRPKTKQFVSRGGLKLQKALDVFDVDVSGKTALDIGASTGGFTDCLLQHGASHVYCVDVGYGQLAWSLRTDERVTCFERTNIRFFTKEQLGTTVDLAVCDVSFISLKLVLPVAKRLLKEDGQVITLIKPQFEAGREKVGKKGVVRNPKVHVQVLEDTVAFARGIGFEPVELTYSPIKGPEGNIEFLVRLVQQENHPTEWDFEKIVREAHEELVKKA